MREAGFAIVSAEQEGQLEGEREVTFLWVLAQVPKNEPAEGWPSA